VSDYYDGNTGCDSPLVVPDKDSCPVCGKLMVSGFKMRYQCDEVKCRYYMDHLWWTCLRCGYTWAHSGKKTP
jgi:RNase P subunit RPR2